MVRTFFWLMIYVTLIALLVNFYMVEILEILIVLLVFDLALIIIITHHSDDGYKDNIESYVSLKLDSIEKITEQTLKRVFSPETQERMMKEEKEVLKWLENF